MLVCVISGFCHAVGENCTLLGYYAVSSDNFLPMFWDNLCSPSSRVLLFITNMFKYPSQPSSG